MSDIRDHSNLDFCVLVPEKCVCSLCSAHRFVRPESSAGVNAVCSPLREAASVPASAHRRALRRAAQHFQQTGDTHTHTVCS